MLEMSLAVDDKARELMSPERVGETQCRERKHFPGNKVIYLFVLTIVLPEHLQKVGAQSESKAAAVCKGDLHFCEGRTTGSDGTDGTEARLPTVNNRGKDHSSGHTREPGRKFLATS